MANSLFPCDRISAFCEAVFPINFYADPVTCFIQEQVLYILFAPNLRADCSTHTHRELNNFTLCNILKACDQLLIGHHAHSKRKPYAKGAFPN
jgi:hypothetical protein